MTQKMVTVWMDVESDSDIDVQRDCDINVERDPEIGHNYYTYSILTQAHYMLGVSEELSFLHPILNFTFEAG